jgi:hypothetical protein
VRPFVPPGISRINNKYIIIRKSRTKSTRQWKIFVLCVYIHVHVRISLVGRPNFLRRRGLAHRNVNMHWASLPRAASVIKKEPARKGRYLIVCFVLDTRVVVVATCIYIYLVIY